MKKLYSFFLTILIVLPSIISFTHHIFEEHKACTETDIHFHQLESECTLCFVLNNTDNSFTNDIEFNFNLVLIDGLVIDSIEYLKSNNLRTFNLRAPPVV